MERCQKKQKRCVEHARDDAGDMWDHPAVAADSTLVVSVRGGQRPDDPTLVFVHDATSRRRPGHFPALCTDALARDEAALWEVLGRRYANTSRGARPV